METMFTDRLISSNFGVILDISLDIFSPNDWVVVIRFEELCDISCPRLNSVKSLAAEDTRHVPMDGSDGSDSKVIAEDSK